MNDKVVLEVRGIVKDFPGLRANDNISFQLHEGEILALLGGISPVGVVFASIFFAILQTGKGFMSVMTKIAPEIADTIIAIIIYFAAISKFVDRYFDRFLAWYRKKHTGGGKK